MENTPANPEQTPTDAIAGYHDEISQIHAEGMELGVKKARNALFWTAGLILFWEIFGYIRSGLEPEPLVIALVAIVVGIFIGLALWTKKKPYTAIVTGLIVFIAYWALVVVSNYLVDGSGALLQAIFGGIIVKIIILVTLFKALNDAKELQQTRSESIVR